MESWKPENWSGRLEAVVQILARNGYVARVDRLEEYTAHIVMEGNRITYYCAAEGMLMTSVGGFEPPHNPRKFRLGSQRRHFQSGNPTSIASSIIGDLQYRASCERGADQRRTFEKANVKPVESELMQLCDGINGIAQGDVTVSGTSTVKAGKREAQFTLNIDVALPADKIRAVLALLTQLNADMPAQTREFEDEAVSS